MNVLNRTFKMPLWSMGFRPFFLMVIFTAIIPTAVWVMRFTGVFSFSFDPLTANQWHANEMIFGFLMAAILGFLLTASANWTGTRGLHGRRLFLFFSLFFVARTIFWLTPFDDIWVYIFVGSLVPLLLVIYLAKLFLETNNRRNFVVVAALAVFGAGQVLLLSSKYQTGYELGLYSVRFLLVVIAGRVIPFFTRRAIQMEPRWDFPLLEKATIACVFLLIFEPLFRGEGVFGEYLWLGLTSLALILNIYRLANWRFFSSFKVKILFILYFAYLWLPIHFALNLCSYFQWINDLGRSGLHALSFGSMGIMILGIIHRVTLGHTGRPIKAGTMPVIGYALIGTGSFLRVFGPLIMPLHYFLWLKISAVLWVLAFIAVAFEILPMLISPRADGKEY